MEQQSIPEFFKNKSVLITGGTGFIGKVLVEKLLRSCPGINTIYFLCRPKKDKITKERLQEVKSSPAFDIIREKNPQALKKIILIEGDTSMLELGISRENQKILKENVEIVIHSAASTKFTEPLKAAVNTNLRGMRELLNLVKQMTNLKSFVHISTVYTNFFELDVKEEIYPTEYDPDYILNLCETLTDPEIDVMTPKLLGRHVNTYTFTKALVENLLNKESKNVPISIIRPSLIGASVNEPKVGWIDTLSALSVYVYVIGSGAYRASQVMNVNAPCELIPVDIVANMSIAAAWKAGITQSNDKFPLIYHCTSGVVNPLKWTDIGYWTIDAGRKFPFKNVYWYPQIRIHKTRIGSEIDLFFTHLIPAFLMDIGAKIMRKKPRAVKSLKTIKRMHDATRFAIAVPTKYQASNFKNILNSMTEKDKEQFNIDPRTIEWRKYALNYYFGIKKFILKENNTDDDLAKKRLYRLKVANFIVSRIIGISILIIFVKILLYCTD